MEKCIFVRLSQVCTKLKDYNAAIILLLTRFYGDRLKTSQKGFFSEVALSLMKLNIESKNALRIG